MTTVNNPSSPYPGFTVDTPQLPQSTLDALDKLIKSGNLSPPPPEGLNPGRSDTSSAAQRPALAEPSLSPEDAIYSMMALRDQLADQQLKVSENDIESIRQEKMEKHEERMKEIEETYDKMKEAEKSGDIGKVFGWVATAAMAVASVAMIAAGAALIATGGGAVAGGLLIAAGVMMLGATALMLTQQISEETGGWLMEGMADGIQFIANDIFGADISDEDAKMAAMITFTVAVAALAIAATVCTLGAGALAAAPGAAGAATATASTTAGAAGTASTAAGAAGTAGSAATTASTLSSAAAAASQIASKVAAAANIIGGAAQIGQGATTIHGAVKTKEAEDARANSMEIFAFIQKMQGVMEDEMERIKEILERMQSGAQVAMDMMKGQAETKSYLIGQQTV